MSVYMQHINTLQFFPVYILETKVLGQDILIENITH